LSEAERLRLLDIAAEANIRLVEDAAYEALRFEGEHVPSCLALECQRSGGINASRVIYCGTFSKTLAPGLRTGWVCASRDVVRKIVLIKQAADLHASTLTQMIIHGVAEALYPQHVAKLVSEYSKRRDAMLSALETYMPDGVTWTKPRGGMFVWLTLPPGVDTHQLLSDALERERIAFVPGAAFYAGRSNANTCRLSFALQPPASIDEGIARLARVFAEHMQAKQRRPVTSLIG
jgi:DNA-binding transcriptional MocR family regulator